MNAIHPLFLAALLAALAFPSDSVAVQPRAIILDADTANEVDDLFAVARAVIEPSWNILALNATQWQASQWAVPNTMEASHRLNMALLAQLGVRDVKFCRGSAERMFDWGDKARHSEAASEIITQAQALPEGERLDVVALGALTNVASALLIAPEIESKLVVYWLGSVYEFDRQRLRHTEFNCVMDIQALDTLLSSQVEMHIMPVNVASAMRVSLTDAKERLSGMGQAADFMLAYWGRHLDGSIMARVLWDLALVQAMIHPEKTTQIKDHGLDNPNVWIYSDFDAAFFWDEFCQTLEAWERER